MGYALMWVEGLAVALLCLALAATWAARGGAARWLWVAFLNLVFLSLAAAAVAVTYKVHSRPENLVRTTWFAYALSWLAAFTGLSIGLLRQGLRRPGVGLARPAASWPCSKLWLG